MNLSKKTIVTCIVALSLNMGSVSSQETLSSKETPSSQGGSSSQGSPGPSSQGGAVQALSPQVKCLHSNGFVECHIPTLSGKCPVGETKIGTCP